MLEYTHAFNDTVYTKPFHIHCLASDTEKVKIHLNDQYMGEFKPNKSDVNNHIGHEFNKYFDISDEQIFNLLVTGTLVNYDSKTNKAIFNDRGIIYIQNSSGAMLYHNRQNNTYSWSSTERSRFFFNPYYFDSKRLWQLKFGAVPTSVKCNAQWPAETEELFMKSIYLTEQLWEGEKTLSLVEPLEVSHYSRFEQGVEEKVYVDDFLNLPHVVDGDRLRFDNGKISLEVTVRNSGDIITNNESIVITARPMVHVPIQMINPNKLYHFTKGLDKGTQEVVSIYLLNKTITVNVIRT